MSEQDRIRWDATYSGGELGAPPGPPSAFAAHARVFPTTGTALDLACGPGLSAVWLAQRGLEVRGVDVSPVAIAHAVALAERHGVADRCRFDVVDLDDGLPDGPAVDVLLCHRFRDPTLYRSIVERLAPRGILAICVLSEAGVQPGRFRATPGELPDAFGGLQIIAEHEAGGEAWLLARAG